MSNLRNLEIILKIHKNTELLEKEVRRKSSAPQTVVFLKD